MTNLKALLKFTHENISSSRWDMDADDYSEFMYLHEKAMGELGRVEEVISVAADSNSCPPVIHSLTCGGDCEKCWKSYIDRGE